MDFNILKNVKTKNSVPIDLELLKSRLKVGNAMLFTGAGFSLGTKNTFEKEPPLASGLSKQISVLAGIDEDDELRFTSNYYLRNNEDKLPLLKLLKDNFVLSEVSDYHNSICSINWRRFYTTNYDNSIELSCLNNNIQIEAIGVDKLPKNYINNRNLCIHLNGHIKNSEVSDLDSKIKLSDASYLSSDSFNNSPWRSVFKQDLEGCSAIIFVGYSLYDFDIQKLLFDLPHLLEKTYFIIREEATFKENFQLSPFGKVMPIGIENFAKIIEEVKSQPEIIEENFEPEAFVNRPYKPAIQISDSDTDNLLLFGRYDIHQIDKAISQNYEIPFLIKRTAIDKVYSLLMSGEHVLIHSDLGNGKSLFLDCIGSYLNSNGITTYFLENSEGDYLKDIELLSKRSDRVILVVDNYYRYNDILENISIYRPANISLLLAERNNFSMSIISKVSKLDIEVNTISLDSLDVDEVSDVTELLSNHAYWKGFSDLSVAKKTRKINHQYNNQISNILLGLLKSPNIADKIEKLISEIFTSENQKRTLFSIALCDVLGIAKRPNIISDIAGDDTIFKSSYRTNPAFSSLYTFSLNSSEIVTKSSLLSLFIINEFFSETYVKNECIRIVTTFNTADYQEREKLSIAKSLLRFHTIEKLMPQKQAAINNYYMELKRECTWLINQDHYWVQYAMCKITFDDYPNAQRFLDTAYALASRKDKNYHTENIDTQQARLFLLQCIQESDISKAFEYFENAHKLLCALTNDGFKFRQIMPYRDVYEKIFIRLNKRQKVNFEQSCKFIVEQISKLNSEGFDLHLIKRIEFIGKAEELLNGIIDEIKNNRGK